MAAMSSTMLPLGTPAPDFTLPDTVSGKMVSLSEIKSPVATVVMFICNHCPYVVHVRDELARAARDYQPKGVRFAAISSNDVEKYPEDSPDKMKLFAKESGFDFPYLYDESQDVARAYRAACTPDLFVFDGGLKLVYRGQLDGARPKNDIPVTGEDLRRALDSIVSGHPVDPNQVASIGCGIKWKEAV
ncbi:MAG: thioredoxin family protein [Deltaproteobacteria bacterium]|nr:thioredoxin family protein [Deltaproteobacteria bacterium]